MENNSSSFDREVEENIQKTTKSLGKNPKDIVDKNCPLNFQQLIRQQISTTSSLQPAPFPSELREKLDKLVNQQASDLGALDHPPTQSLVMPGSGSKKPNLSKDAPGKERKEKKDKETSDIILELPTPIPAQPVFSQEQLAYFVNHRQLSVPLNNERLAVALWQLANGLTACKTECDKLKKRIRQEQLNVEAEADRVRDLENELKHTRSGVCNAEDKLEEARSVIQKMESSNNELSRKIAHLTASPKELDDENKRAQLYASLSDMHPSLIKTNWINVDNGSPMGYFMYPIFTQEGKFFNPYKTLCHRG